MPEIKVSPLLHPQYQNYYDRVEAILTEHAKKGSRDRVYYGIIDNINILEQTMIGIIDQIGTNCTFLSRLSCVALPEDTVHLMSVNMYYPYSIYTISYVAPKTIDEKQVFREIDAVVVRMEVYKKASISTCLP